MQVSIFGFVFIVVNKLIVPDIKTLITQSYRLTYTFLYINHIYFLILNILLIYKKKSV